MQVKLKETTYCDASFRLEGLVVDVIEDGKGYAVLGSELIKNGAPLAVNIGNMGYDPEYYYHLYAYEVVIVSQEQVTWEETAQACNNIFKTSFGQISGPPRPRQNYIKESKDTSMLRRVCGIE